MKHGREKQFASDKETVAFNFGHLYRTIEEHVESFAAQTGGALTVAQVAERVAQLLSDKAVRWASGSAELVSEMRQVGMGFGLSQNGQQRTAKNVHVRARHRRTLSVSARARIAAAQRERWAKYNAKKAGSGRGKLSKAARKRSAKGIKSYWAENFPTPELRSAEVRRRRKVRERNNKAAAR